MKKLSILVLCAALLLSGCMASAQSGEQPKTAAQAQEVPTASGNLFAMDTVMTLTCYGERCEEALEAAKKEILRLDGLLSVGIETSEIFRINTQGSGPLTEDGDRILREALRLWERTGGAFDITVYPLMELWGFTTQEFRVPEQEELDRILSSVGSDGLLYDTDSRELSLGTALGVDLGGIAKGYTSGRLMEIFEEYGLTAGLVSLGGNVQCCGTKPDGSLWRFGIQDPFAPNTGKFLGILSISDGAVITSGAYERFFEEDGVTYHHILDPKTGCPANEGLVSVTIVSKDGMLADGLSTSMYILGLEKATEYWREYGEDFDMILMTSGGEVYVTEPLSGSLVTDYPVTVIRP